MKIIAPTACNDVDSGAGVAAVLRREVRRLDFDFLDEVNSDIVDLAIVAARVHIEPAIN